MTNQLDVLWERLRHYQIVDGPRPGILVADTPWYVKVVLAVSGWISALFLIAFILSVFTGVVKSAPASFVFGAMLLCCAFYALRDTRDFISHAGFALSLAGQVFVVYAVGKALNEQFALTAVFTAVLALGLFFVIDVYLHKVYCAFTACIALYLAVNFSHLENPANGFYGVKHAVPLAIYAFISAWSWLNEFRNPVRYETTRALAWGVSLSVIVIGSFAIFNAYPGFASNRLNELMLGGVFVWTVVEILKRQSVTNPRVKFVCIASAIALGALSCVAPGIVIGLLFVLLAYQQRNRVLLGLGFLALGAYLSRYYYLLEHSLAYKSGILLLTGIACLIIRTLLSKIAERADTDTTAGIS